MHYALVIAQIPGSRTTEDDKPGTGWGAVPFFIAFVVAIVITVSMKRWLRRGLPAQGNAGESVDPGAGEDTSEEQATGEGKSERQSDPKHGA